MELSALQLDHFLTNGYLVIEKFFTPSICETLIDRVNFIINEYQQDIPVTVFTSETQDHAKTEYFLNSGDKIRLFFEPEAFNEQGNMTKTLEKSLNKIGHALHVLDPIFRLYSKSERLKTICHQLGFEKPGLLQSMYLFKQPGIGSEVGCHQDSTFLHSPKDALGFWFALEDATLENGCLQVMPSPTTIPLSRKMIRKGDAIEFEDYYPLIWQDKYSVPVEVKQGSLVVLHGRLPHKSNANHSNKSRHAYILHAIDAACPYPDTNWLRMPKELPHW
ncbi:phytanoyl-CoA dioxygenase family protein [Legionella quinlivanii]|uniref:phytanoyl-CoA dioxygenase family protein n=1 Tax=Legionella quinlivanii TaxID=45073 RepID=UPI0022449875|nr:phytanoyl-CoA dioxygenase family protein [Legionella quinlivanii]MCW8450406.1 phytanoyl-CoA dioxygenase family protein [Legionella quinlivanii]